MQTTSIGDLAQSFINRRANARLTAELSKLGTELTTGLKANVGSAVSGDTGPLTAIDRALSRLTAWGTATTEAKLVSDTMQGAMERIHDGLGALTSTLLTVPQGGDPTAIATAAASAAETFRTTVAALNTTIAGQSLFSGAATGDPALRDPDAMLAAITAAVGGAPDAAGVEALLDDYFGPGGGFETDDYIGGATRRGPVRVADGTSVDLSLKADDAGLRDTLKALAKVAVLDRGVLAGDPVERDALLRSATDDMIASGSAIVGIRAGLGTAQERVDRTISRNAVERQTLLESRLDLLAADPYETVARMEQVQAQLESLYTVTARLSRLNLTNYLG